MIIRTAGPSDHQEIRALLLAAFSSPAEANLVEQLRGDGDVVVELAAERDCGIIGHILFSPMTAPFRALALAPIAVLPNQQRQGIGSCLIEAGHECARREGWDAIFVLGEPAYYSRFGYSVAAARPFTSPYAGAYFMMLPLTEKLLPRGDVAHAKAFAAL